MQLDGVKVLSFSGIDGAGKSTQVEALRAHLQELGYRCTLFTFWGDVVAFPRFRERLSLKAFKGDKGIGSPENPIIRRDKNVTSWYVVAIRLVLYLADATRLCMVLARSLEKEADFVIFDRYIFDALANLPLQRRPIRLYVRFLLRFVPKPDIAILLDADPEAAVRRKPEYPLEFVRRNREAYLRLARLAGMNTVPPMSAEQATAVIRSAVAASCLHSNKASLTLSSAAPAEPWHG